MAQYSPVSAHSNDSQFTHPQVEHDLIDNIAGDFAMEDYLHQDQNQRKKQKKSNDVEPKKTFVRASSSKRQSYNLLRIQQAYKVYDEYKAANVKDLQKSVSASLGVPQGTFAGWLKHREQNEEKMRIASEKEMNHMQGKGNCSHPFFPEEEAQLRDIIIARRANNEPCSGDFIRTTMMKLVNASNHKGKVFTASHNWLTHFSHRMNVPNRKGPIPGTLKANKSGVPLISVEHGQVAVYGPTVSMITVPGATGEPVPMSLQEHSLLKEPYMMINAGQGQLSGVVATAAAAEEDSDSDDEDMVLLQDKSAHAAVAAHGIGSSSDK